MAERVALVRTGEELAAASLSNDAQSWENIETSTEKGKDGGAPPLKKCSINVRADASRVLRIVGCSQESLEILGAQTEAALINKDVLDILADDESRDQVKRKSWLIIRAHKSVTKTQNAKIRLPLPQNLKDKVAVHRNRTGKATDLDDQSFIPVMAQFTAHPSDNSIVVIRLREVYLDDAMDEDDMKEPRLWILPGILALVSGLIGGILTWRFRSSGRHPPKP